MTKLAMNQWPLSERPREKMFSLGCDSLSDAELVAILLNSGNRTDSKTALDLSMELLEKHGGLDGLASASFAELMSRKGVGLAKACRIKAGLEIAHRRQKQSTRQTHKIISAQQVFDFFKTDLCGSIEKTGIIFLDGRNRILHQIMLEGTFNRTTLDIRRICRECFRLDAQALIVSHNHPSGIAEPTPTDRESTRELAGILAHIGVVLLDHVVISETRFFSFSENNLL